MLFYRWDFRWWMLWLMLRAYLYLVFLLKPSLVKVGYLHLFVFNSILHWINWNKFRFLSFFWNHCLVEFFIGSSNYTLVTTWYCLKHYLLMVVMEWVLGMQINNTIEGYKLRHIKLNYLLGTMAVRGRWDNGILSFLDFSFLIYNHYDNSSVFQDLLEMFQWCLPSPRLLWMQVVSL